MCLQTCLQTRLQNLFFLTYQLFYNVGMFFAYLSNARKPFNLYTGLADMSRWFSLVQALSE